MISNVLSVAGSDPSGGAGIQADLKTFSALGCYGMAAITALTAQNTQGVQAVEALPASFVKAQITAVFEDIDVHGVKIGMIADAAIAEAVADVLDQYRPSNIVLDPVMVATSGDALIAQDAVHVLKERLLPMADVITPNIPEAEKLLRKAVLDVKLVAQDLLSFGCGAALLKGGHLGHGDNSDDVLAFGKGEVQVFEGKRIDTNNTHGTGCTLSSAIAAYLARGHDLPEAVKAAKEYVTGSIKAADSLGVGSGHGPVHHFWKEKS